MRAVCVAVPVCRNKRNLSESYTTVENLWGALVISKPVHTYLNYEARIIRFIWDKKGSCQWCPVGVNNGVLLIVSDAYKKARLQGVVLSLLLTAFG